jgi:hypothetical protein
MWQLRRMTVREALEEVVAGTVGGTVVVIEEVVEAVEVIVAETAEDTEVAEAEEADISNLITRKTWTTIRVATAMPIRMEKKEQTD